MLCRRPYMSGNIPFGCGQCLPCRVNRRRQWMWRQFLESLCHEENSFITLTYNSEFLPKNGSLEQDVVRDWIKRVRFAIQPKRIRYFLVGEYGEQTLRPHYHVSLFGLSRDSIIKSGSHYKTFSKIVDETWGRGFTLVAEFNELTAQYVSGYVVKKLTDGLNDRLGHRTPEFARMSNRPGLGSGAMRVVAEQLLTTGRWEAFFRDTGDVPRVLKIGRRTIPIGRYLLRRLRNEIGLTEEQVNEIKGVVGVEKSLEMSALLQAALADGSAQTSKEVHLREVMQRILQVESRATIWSKKGAL